MCTHPTTMTDGSVPTKLDIDSGGDKYTTNYSSSLTYIELDSTK